MREDQPLGRRRAGHGSDLGWLVSLPRFCNQLAALRTPETDDSTREGVPKLLSFLQTSRAAFRPLDPGSNNLANESTPEGVG